MVDDEVDCRHLRRDGAQAERAEIPNGGGVLDFAAIDPNAVGRRCERKIIPPGETCLVQDAGVSLETHEVGEPSDCGIWKVPRRGSVVEPFCRCDPSIHELHAVWGGLTGSRSVEG